MHTADTVRAALMHIVSEQVGLDLDRPSGETFKTMMNNNAELMTNVYDEAGTDSLDEIELLMALEEHYEVEISDNDAMLFFSRDNTVGQTLDFLVKWLNVHKPMKEPA